MRLKIAAIPHDEAYFREMLRACRSMAATACSFSAPSRRAILRNELLRFRNALGAGARMTTRPERFGLTMIEAMACGTPVLGARMGSIPEIVVDGVTGFLCDDVNDAGRAKAACSTAL